MTSKQTTFRRGALAAWLAVGWASLTGCAAESSPDPSAKNELGSQDSVSVATAISRAARRSSKEFFVPPPNPSAVAQIVGLLEGDDWNGALDLAALLAQSRAVWFTNGTPDEVHESVETTMRQAASQRRVPVLVAYDVPFRDCAQYSAGGAVDTPAYEAWIDAFSSGIGEAPAVVVLEPDSLGIIPYNSTLFGTAEWCKPTVTDSLGTVSPAPGASPADRYAQLAHALVSLSARAPQARVYVDATTSAWLGVGEAAFRVNHLTTMASQAAQAEGLAFDATRVGFYVNVSNYQPTDQSIQFGTWVSDCIAAVTAGAPWAAGHFDWCAGQYNPALNYTLDYSPAYAATVTASLQNMMGGAPATVRFLIDTGRNGQGPLNAARYAVAPYNQPASAIGAIAAGSWCNPPGAGVGLRPSADTRVPLLDAFLWIKIPGESDGSCDIAGGARGWDYSFYDPWGISGDAGRHFDPLWGMVDPAAGVWFPQAALQLAHEASPPLLW